MENTDDIENIFIDTSIVKEEYGLEDVAEGQFVMQSGVVPDFATSTSKMEVKEELHTTFKVEEMDETLPSSFQGYSKKSKSSTNLSKKPPVPEEIFTCSECDKTFKFLRYLKRHKAIHTVNRPSFSCQLCSKVFKWSKNLAAHRKICVALQTAAALPDANNITLRLFICDLCQKQFAYKQELKSHMWTHIRDRPQYACKYCGNKYNTSQSRGQHAKACKEMTVLPHIPCIKCGNKFHKPSSLAQHLRMCKKPRKQKDNSKGCTICGKEFTNYCDFKNHAKTHAQDRNKYACPCGVSYYWASNLRRHKKTCDNSMIVLNFFCRTCGNGFEEKDAKDQHELICCPQNTEPFQNSIWLPETQNSSWLPENEVEDCGEVIKTDFDTEFLCKEIEDDA